MHVPDKNCVLQICPLCSCWTSLVSEATQEMGQSTFTFYKNEQSLVEWDAHPREEVDKLY